MDIRLPSFRAIEAFISAAETSSFTEAAQRLNVTSSAVSHRIATLEEELGVALFERDGKRISLTKDGDEYYRSISPLIEGLKRSTHHLNKSVRDKNLSISSFDLMTENWLSERIGKFLRIHPEANIEIRSLRLRKFIEPDITIKIIREGEERVGFDKLFDFNIMPVCTQNLVEEQGIRTPDDLIRTHIIETVSARDVWPRWLAQAGLGYLSFDKYILVDSASLQVNLIKQGVGVGMMTDFLLDATNDGLVSLFDIRHPYSGGIFINRPTRHEREIVRAFRAWIYEEASTR